MQNLLCSILVCTNNRADMLRRMLQSLAIQTISPQRLQVVVVDNGSADHTAAVCQEMGHHFGGFIYHKNMANLGCGSARKQTSELASHELLLCIDDDCIANADWVEQMLQALQMQPLVAGAIVSATGHYWQLCHNIAHFYFVMPYHQAGQQDNWCNANMGIRRAVLDAGGGFDDARLGEDFALLLRLRSIGYRPFFVPAARVRHDPPGRNCLRACWSYASSHAAVTVLWRCQYRQLLRTPLALRSSMLLLLASPLIALAVTVKAYAQNPYLLRFFHTIPAFYLLKLAWCWGASRSLWRNKKL